MQKIDALQRVLGRVGMSVTNEVSARLLGYLDLLEKWNARVNLTSSTEWGALEPLLAESIWAAGQYRDEPVSHLDIGSGAGFPAIVLGILRPRVRLALIESRLKRATFLETLIHDLDLTNVSVFRLRLNAFLRMAKKPVGWDFVSSKGVRLKRPEVSLLVSMGKSETEYWIFHGKEIPWEGIGSEEALLSLTRRDSCPFRKASFLSVYARVSRETDQGCFM